MANHDKKPIEYNQSMFGKLFDLSDYDLSGTIDVDELVSMVELDTQRVACFFLFYYCVVLLGAATWYRYL